MMQHQDPFFATRWLLTVCAAMGIAFIFAVASSGCTVREDRSREYEEVQVSGAEMPVYTESEVDDLDQEAELEARAEAEPEVGEDLGIYSEAEIFEDEERLEDD